MSWKIGPAGTRLDGVCDVTRSRAEEVGVFKVGGGIRLRAGPRRDQTRPSLSALHALYRKWEVRSDDMQGWEKGCGKTYLQFLPSGSHYPPIPAEAL